MPATKELLLAAAFLLGQTLWAQESATPVQTPATPADPTAQVPSIPAQSPAGKETAATSAAAKSYEVPAGTKVLLSLKSAVNTKTARPGDGVYLVSTFPVAIGNKVLIPAGVYVQGVIDRVQRPGRVKGRAQVGMHFTSMIFPNGSVVQIPGVVSSLPGSDGAQVKDREGTVEQKGSKGQDAATAVGTAMEGAGVGAIAGGVNGSPLKGALIGGLAGAAVGEVVTLFTRGNEVDIAQGTSLEMILQRPLTLEEANLVGNEDVPGFGPTGLVPASGQQRPMERPKRRNNILCPPGGLGCN